MLGRVDSPRLKILPQKSSISATTSGGSIVADFFNYQWRLETRIRQGQVGTDKLKVEKKAIPICSL